MDFSVRCPKDEDAFPRRVCHPEAAPKFGSAVGLLCNSVAFQVSGNGNVDLQNIERTQVDRIRGIWGYCYNIPKATYSIYCRGTMNPKL